MPPRTSIRMVTTPSELTARELMVPAVVIDIADRAAADPDAVVTIADLRKHERRYGRIDRGRPC